MINILMRSIRYARLYFIHRLERKNNTNDYLNSSITDYIVDKSVKFQKQLQTDNVISKNDMSPITALGLCRPANKLKILEFGGGSGNSFYIARKFFHDLKFDWHVIETVFMAESAKNRIHQEGLYFYSNQNEIVEKDFDLLYINSSLQYTQDPLAELTKLLAIKPEKIFITRQLLTNNQTSKFQQRSKMNANGPLSSEKSDNTEITYPVIAEKKDAFEQILLQNYDIISVINEEQHVFRYVQSNMNYYGYYCERK